MKEPRAISISSKVSDIRIAHDANVLLTSLLCDDLKSHCNRGENQFVQ